MLQTITRNEKTCHTINVLFPNAVLNATLKRFKEVFFKYKKPLLLKTYLIYVSVSIVVVSMKMYVFFFFKSQIGAL